MWSSPYGPDMSSSFVGAMQHTFVLAANDWEFKNGAFKNKITSSTTALEALEMMLASGLLSAHEKRELETCHQAIRTALKRGPQMSNDEALMLGLETMGVTEVFEADRKKQGHYVPPMVAYSIGKDNEVTKTTEITNDGIRETSGGEVGHIPSAPKGWKAGNAGGKRGQTKPEKTGEANEKAAKGKTPTPAMASTKAAGKFLKEDPDKGAADQMSGPKKSKATNEFGAAFKKNLRGAFA